MKIRFLLAGWVVIASFCGCVAPPPPADQTGVSAYYVGDRARVAFEELVISLPLREAKAPYQNLHVSIAVLVNPQRKSYSTAYDVERIMRRLEVRVAAQILEMFSGKEEQSLENMERLRRRIQTEAQTVVDQALRQWEHGSDYRAEATVASLYWTDVSVGRLPQTQRGGWG